MRIFITLFLSAFFIFSIANAEETSHRFHGKKASRTYSYNYDYNYDYQYDYEYEYDYDFDFDFDFDNRKNVKWVNVEDIDDIDGDYIHDSHYRSGILDDIDMDFRGSTIVITHDRRDDVVEITDDYDLIINDDKVRLDADQRQLVGEFYVQSRQLTEQAKLVGKEGARIGIKGAKLGVSAVFKVLHLLSPNYDTDDLEREIEAEAELIEADAEDLERYAEDIEDMADDIEDLAEQMNDDIPEINRLGWF